MTTLMEVAGGDGRQVGCHGDHQVLLAHDGRLLVGQGHSGGGGGGAGDGRRRRRQRWLQIHSIK